MGKVPCKQGLYFAVPVAQWWGTFCCTHLTVRSENEQVQQNNWIKLSNVTRILLIFLGFRSVRNAEMCLDVLALDWHITVWLAWYIALWSRNKIWRAPIKRERIRLSYMYMRQNYLQIVQCIKREHTQHTILPLLWPWIGIKLYECPDI